MDPAVCKLTIGALCLETIHEEALALDLVEHEKRLRAHNGSPYVYATQWAHGDSPKVSSPISTRVGRFVRSASRDEQDEEWHR